MRRTKILVADDEKYLITELLEELCIEFGKDCYDYESKVYRAIERIKQKDYLCIILDITIPYGNRTHLNEKYAGLIALHEIREVYKKTTPIIFYTVRKEEDIMKQIKKYTNTFIVHKGVNSLAAVIKTIKLID